jgi:NADPH:quinone reductase-like Zn-dependent oxidoreductase
VQERPIPTPKGDDVLIEVTAVGLNPIECMSVLAFDLTTGKIIEYGLFGEPPSILGYDVAGVIEQVGPDVKNYKKGDRMYETFSFI